MKRFINWLTSDSRKQSAANEAEGEHSDNYSFSWTEIDQADSSIFDTRSLYIEKSEDKNAVSHMTPDLEGDSLCGAEEDMGFDPYDSGRFDTGNK